ncbi:MAG: Lcl C-terminal domain-containing protein, partial [Deferrisomatales bacterium]
MLREPLVIARARSRANGVLVGDLATGAPRFTVSQDGVIADGMMGLEWAVGPDRDTTYGQAQQWVANLAVAGGGWRMPTRRELATLYQKGVG